MRLAPLFAAFLALAACSGPDAAEAAEAAQTALNEGEPDLALALVAEALPAARQAGDRALCSRLETLELLALADAGQVQAVLEGIDQWDATDPDRVTAQLYARLATRAGDAGWPEEAIELARAGCARFPERTREFGQMIAAGSWVWCSPSRGRLIGGCGYHEGYRESLLARLAQSHPHSRRDVHRER